MPKLEAIVNQEPKEQEVPTFNKKEIEGIAKEVVDEALVGVGGGTKLYLHTITVNVDYGGDVFESTCKITATTNQSLSNKTIHDAYKIGYLSGLIDKNGNGRYEPIIYMTLESESGIYIMDNYGSMERIECNKFGVDTITEL